MNYNNDMLGLDNDIEKEETKKENNITSIDEAKKKRKPFHYWTVGGVDYKMKLNTSMVTKLESKYGTNIMNLIISDNIPSLSVMLTVAQAAIAPWNHGCSIEKAQAIYDQWIEEGGSQTDFMSKVIIPTLAVSGFFTTAQTESLMARMEESDILN